jgi:ribosomal protein L12E/L44/L45/RPP1/RPP2
VESAPAIRSAYVKTLLTAYEGHLIKEGSITTTERCCFCWRGSQTAQIPDHYADGCPLLRTFNKIRTNEQLPPIIITDNTFEVGAKKEPVKAERVAKDLAKEVKGLKEIIRGIDSRLQAAESQLGTKRKADSPKASASKKKKTQHTPQAAQQVPKQPMAPGGSRKKGKGKAT